MFRSLNDMFGPARMVGIVEKRQHHGELQYLNNTDFCVDRQESTVLQPV